MPHTKSLRHNVLDIPVTSPFGWIRHFWPPCAGTSCRVAPGSATRASGCVASRSGSLLLGDQHATHFQQAGIRRLELQHRVE